MRDTHPDYTWPVANALGCLEDMKQTIKDGDRNDPPATEHDRKELMNLCMNYSISVVEGIIRNSSPKLPTYQESFYHLTKKLRHRTADLLEDAAGWLRELGTNYRFDRNADDDYQY